jgi:pimeloyl-ACP methyl ester carboxylesterase
MKKYILLLLIFTLMKFGDVSAQDKNVYWLHGLNDGSNAWLHYSGIFSLERRMNSTRPGYDSGDGVNIATGFLNSFIPANPNNIGIGHSMGGIVLRNLERTQSVSSKKINGLITVASPNSGAGIANSFNDNSLLAASQKACSDVTAGPITELFGLPWKTATLGIVSALGADFTTTKLCELFISNDLLEQFAGSSIAREDLRQGSPLIQQLNSRSSAIPQLTMVAQENSPVHWRLIGSIATRNRPVKNDQFLADAVSITRGVYNGFYITRVTGTVVNTILGFINPAAFAAAVLNGIKAAQWKKGRDWIDDSETIWNGLTKSSRMETQTYGVHVWRPCQDPFPPIMQRISSSQNQECDVWVWETRTRNVMVHHPSDGFIPSYSQDIASLPASNRYFINGANHIELLNMSNSSLNGVPNDATKVEFDNVFQLRSDIFFVNPR